MVESDSDGLGTWLIAIFVQIELLLLLVLGPEVWVVALVELEAVVAVGEVEAALAAQLDPLLACLPASLSTSILALALRRDGGRLSVLGAQSGASVGQL